MSTTATTVGRAAKTDGKETKPADQSQTRTDEPSTTRIIRSVNLERRFWNDKLIGLLPILDVPFKVEYITRRVDVRVFR